MGTLQVDVPCLMLGEYWGRAGPVAVGMLMGRAIRWASSQGFYEMLIIIFLSY